MSAKWVLVAGFALLAVVGLAALVASRQGNSQVPMDPQSTSTPEPPCVAGESDVAIGGAGEFCIAWRDRRADELGFRVTLDYGNGSEVFVYETGPDTQWIVPPASDAPVDGTVDLNACLARSNVQVLVEALLSSDVDEVGRAALSLECASTSG